MDLPCFLVTYFGCLGYYCAVDVPHYRIKKGDGMEPTVLSAHSPNRKSAQHLLFAREQGWSSTPGVTRESLLLVAGALQTSHGDPETRLTPLRQVWLGLHCATDASSMVQQMLPGCSSRLETVFLTLV